MSEYWKSTPKYWCKHCSVFVRDTKIEKQNHEATGKHQGALKRFLRDIHKNNEREEREKQRAKDEIQRLNGIVSGSGTTKTASAAQPGAKDSKPSKGNERQATAADRKLQLAQLAELGVVVPEEFRGQMAMVGDWQATGNTQDTATEPSSGVRHIGVRKRKLSNEDEDQPSSDIQAPKHRRWGTDTKSYPGYEDADADLDDLLKSTGKPNLNVKSEVNSSDMTSTTVPSAVKQEPQSPSMLGPKEGDVAEEAKFGSEVKKEPSDERKVGEEEKSTRPEESPEPVIFKKRKPKFKKAT